MPEPYEPLPAITRFDPEMPFDVLIVGAGQAAMPLAASLAEQGKRVAVAERDQLGGSCVNFGCTPTKAVIASARLAHRARRAAEFGLRIPTVEVDFPAVLQSAREIIQESRDSLMEMFQGYDTLTLLPGHARLTGREQDHFLLVVESSTGKITARAKTVVLDTGSRARIPEIPGLDSLPFFTADTWINGDTLPARLLILGGGYIGLEMGQFYRRMGSEVVIIDHNEKVMPEEEEDAARELQRILEEEGIVFSLGAKVTRAGDDGEGGVQLTVEVAGRTQALSGSHLLIAVGRTPNTDQLGLESVGVETGEHGFIRVDKRLATTVENIWAAGDIRGNGLFTHTSWDDYRILLSQLTGDGSRTTDRVVPYAIFTDPQLARVGMTEAKAREAGKSVKTGVYRMERNGQARESRETHGFAKVVVDSETEKLLGATVLSDEAAEVVHLYINTINADAPYTLIRDAVYIHPTLAEGIQSATDAVTGEDRG